jgi:beta-lactamase superfamily II metal-dependent hydrolase
MQRALPNCRPPFRRASLSAIAAAAAILLLVLTWFAAPGCYPPTVPDESDTGPSDVLTSPSFEELLATPAADELPGQLVIYFLDAGQADACVIRTPGGKIVVIDTGASPEPLVGFLESKGIGRLDVMVLTHPHQDHIGGALAVLNRFEVGTLCDSGFVHTTTLYENVSAKASELVNAGRLARVDGRAGVVLECDPALTLTVLHPAEPLGDEANEASVVVRLVFDSFAAFFTGDIGLTSEAAILARGAELSSDVLKVAHHGSARSSGEAFLRAVGPEVAVIQVGAGNRYGHPAQAALDRLEAAGAVIYTTARDGTVVVHTDGREWAVIIGT